MDYYKIEQEFIQACTERGLIVSNPKFDGTWQRVPVKGDKKGKLSGAYRVYLDGLPAGSIFNYKENIKDTWVTGQHLNRNELETLRTENGDEKKQHRQEQQKKQEEIMAKFANFIVTNSLDATNEHPYLRKKGVDAYGVKVVPSTFNHPNILVGQTMKEAKNLRDQVKEQKLKKLVLTKGDLVIPLTDENNKIWSFQTISVYGFKGYLKKAKKSGSHIKMGDITNGQPILIGEGYSTMATLKNITKLPCVSVCDANNLTTVASLLRNKYPDSRIYITSDNDRNSIVNTGLTSAIAAAKKTNGFVLVPHFQNNEEGSDWNDLFIIKGEKEVKAQLNTQLKLIHENTKNHMNELVKLIANTSENVPNKKYEAINRCK